ncbi:hypothetical protein SAMN05660284_01077 [Formivibrio citricus]|uniref:histidine kinase n=1 Tax=Formivibrio citricus TaxID=83765 RepID=A0A1I4XRU8_9NEIS|nr:ATP-binding protein [Formivibrio citricus]SFN28542.1 hypothetical protein SAMN05660284_01077 [Formivibrio citricus]
MRRRLRSRRPRIKPSAFPRLQLERLSPRLSHWLLILPSLAAAVFALAFVIFLVQNVQNDRDRETSQLNEDLQWLKQALRFQVASDQRDLETLSTVLTTQGIGSADFIGRSLSLMQNNPEVLGLEYVDAHGQTRWRAPSTVRSDIISTKHPALRAAREQAIRNNETVLTQLMTDERGNSQIAIVAPVKLAQGERRCLVAWISLRSLLQLRTPWWINQRYEIGLLEADGKPIVARFERTQKTVFTRSVPLELAPPDLLLAASPNPENDRGWESALTVSLALLAVLMIASTWALRLHIKGRQAAEARLRQETAMRRAIEDSLVTGIRAMDLTGVTLYVNRAFSEMVGWSAEELQDGIPPHPYWPPEEQGRCQTVHDAILTGQFDTNGFQMKLMRKNGERFDVRIYVAPLVDGDGKHTGWISSVYDITELQHEREALQAAHERFVTVLNGLDSGVCVSHADSGEVLLSNAHFDRAFGLPEQRGPCCVAPFFPRHATLPIDAEWFDVYRNRWYYIQNRRSVWVDGTVVWLDTATDITARRDAAERERLQNEQLQQTARLVSMGEMASSLAHELNQPLAAIASYASGCRNLLAQDRPDLHQLDQAMEKMSGQAKRAGQIIRGIREFVQRQAPHRSLCHIGELFDTVEELLKAELQMNRIRLTIEQETELPPLFADAVMLEQVIFNLMRNAVEAMLSTPADRRTLQVRLSRDHDQLRVVIADRGTGIVPEQLEQLFKPFYTTKETGMGMGLNICRSIIEHHQGRLWVEPNPGGGSRFIFTVPFCEEAPNHES